MMRWNAMILSAAVCALVACASPSDEDESRAEMAQGLSKPTKPVPTDDPGTKPVPPGDEPGDPTKPLPPTDDPGTKPLPPKNPNVCEAVVLGDGKTCVSITTLKTKVVATCESLGYTLQDIGYDTGGCKAGRAVVAKGACCK